VIGWLVLGIAGWAMILAAIVGLIIVATRRALRGKMEGHDPLDKRRRDDA
jgi:hypothetical protein